MTVAFGVRNEQSIESPECEAAAVIPRYGMPAIGRAAKRRQDKPEMNRQVIGSVSNEHAYDHRNSDKIRQLQRSLRCGDAQCQENKSYNPEYPGEDGQRC